MYNKIFTKILDSSIWMEESPTRIVWMTFIAAMDETGFTQFASVANLAHRARVTMVEAQAAVACLEGPDENSSDPDHEGRRIERVPGGWMVLNSGKYRDLVNRVASKEGTRRRVAEFRDRKRNGVDTQIKAQNGVCECCGLPFPEPYSLYVVRDHNHETGALRGLICQSCNKVVGLVESGRSTISTKAEKCLSYVLKYSGGNADVINGNGTVTQSEAEADTKEKGKAVKPTSPSPSIVVEAWNSTSLPHIQNLSGDRERHLGARLGEPFWVENFLKGIEMADKSDFLKGKNDKGWKITFDFFIKPGSLEKILEGKYANNTPNGKTDTAPEFLKDWPAWLESKGHADPKFREYQFAPEFLKTEFHRERKGRA